MPRLVSSTWAEKRSVAVHVGEAERLLAGQQLADRRGRRAWSGRRRGGRRRAASRRGSGSPRRRRAPARGWRRSSAWCGPRSRRSARDRSCRTGSRRSDAGRGGTPSSPHLAAPAGSSCRPRSHSGRAPGPARCCRQADRPDARRPRARWASSLPKKSHQRRHARCFARRRRRWPPARCRATGTPGLHEPLQEVAVVAGQLDDLARGAEPEAIDHLSSVVPGVLDPAVGERGEIGVLGEDVLGADVLLELHQPAVPAHQNPQRIEGLHRVQLVGPEIALAQR